MQGEGVMMSVFIWREVWQNWSSTHPQTQGFACPHANKVKNLWYSAYRFMWHCLFSVGVSSCGMTLWKLSQIEFQTKKQNYHKNRGQIVDGVSEWWWMVYKIMVMVVVWTWMPLYSESYINFKTNIYFVVFCLDKKQWFHPLWDGLRMLYDVQREDTINVSLYLYTTYFLFITWSYHQSILFIMTSGVKMEGLLSSCDNA